MKEVKVPKRMVFVDVDGVLSAPIFVGYGIGMSEEDWLTYCLINKDTSYDNCQAVPCVSKYLSEASKEAYLYVLTAVGSSFEADAKRKFIAEKYPEIRFDGFIAVARAEDKVPVILTMARDKAFSPTACELIEDDYGTLIRASKHGIKATHIANIAAEY